MLILQAGYGTRYVLNAEVVLRIIMNKYDVTTKYLYEFFTYFGICLFWYKLNAIVEDNTGSTSFLIFG